MVEGGMRCVKYCLFAFNLIFFFIGVGMIICGAVIQASFSEYFEIIGTQFNSAAALLISVGAIILIISFFGCCGAVKENHCMIITFTVLLGIIFVMEIAAGVTAFKLRDEVQDIVEDGLKESMDKYKTAEGTRKAWDALQHNLECCGIQKGYIDWQGKLEDANSYPKSCCKDKEKAVCGKSDAGEGRANAYPNPCVSKMRVFVERNIIWIGIVGICMSFFQILGIISACCLARSIKKEYDTVA